MPKIKQLSSHEAQKIAAGQVVDRPANVVKELIENAIDAHATQISVYIEDGGKKLIRIADNGFGMDKDDAQLCFEKHATSKIERVNDLTSITTFGFRGEALPSIAAVSEINITTKTSNDSEGIQLILIDGTIQNKQPIAFSTGTDISVKNLFYNIPARAKFLKKRETEWRHIVQLFQAFCLDYPSIHFKLLSENKQILNCPPTANITNRFAQLWDSRTAQHMIAIDCNREDKKITIHGAISNHQHFRYDRSGIFFLVNKRWVLNHKLGYALLKGYQNVIPQGRYPMACIAITIDPSLVDINIHPRKEEVRFFNPRLVEQFVQQTVKQALEQNISTQIKRTVSLAQTSSPQDFHPAYQAKSFKPFDFDEYLNKPYNPPPSSEQAEKIPTQNTPLEYQKSNNSNSERIQTISKNHLHNYDNPSVYPKLIEKPGSFTQKNASTNDTQLSYKLIGQYNKTYILIEQQDGLFVIDQHAAQERIFYELFSKRFKDVATINLIFPQTITVTKEDIQTIEPHLNIFQNNGIVAEIFGSDQIIIQSTPVHLKNINLENLMREVISWIQEYQQLDEKEFFKTINEKLHAQMACKAAVKAGDELTYEQMHQLVKDLNITANRFACPHGRPTSWLLTTYEIEKKFKRKL